MGKLIRYFVGFFLVLTILSCGKFESNPESVTENYLNAIHNNNYKQAYKFISTKDKTIKSLQRYVDENTKNDTLLNIFSDRTSYNIKNTSVNNGRAKVYVEVTTPDFKEIFGDLMVAAFSFALGNDTSNSKIKKQLKEKYRNQELPMTTEEKEYDLIRENNKWKVYLNWEKERDNKVNKLLEEAKGLEEESHSNGWIIKDKLDEAKEKYNKVFELDSSNEKASKGIKRIDRKIKLTDKKTKRYFKKVIRIQNLIDKGNQLVKENKLYDAKGKYKKALALKLDSSMQKHSMKIAFQREPKEINQIKRKINQIDRKIAQKNYLDKIEIKNVHIGKSTLGETGVFGEIKNHGDSVLKEVEITIYCLDKNNEPIFEKSYHPVLVSDYSFGDSDKPLKPNYIRKFGVKMDDAPLEWNKQVMVKISDIAFKK